jgi:hypothetical protein
MFPLKAKLILEFRSSLTELRCYLIDADDLLTKYQVCIHFIQRYGHQNDEGEVVQALRTGC